MMSRLLGVFLLLAIATCTASAQITASLGGRITDSAGAGIPNAHLLLTNIATNLRIESNSTSEGNFLFTNLTPGSYRFSVQAPGFERLLRSGITAKVGETVSVDLALKAGGEQETVTVNADAPLLQTAVSDIETHIPGSTVVAIPLNSRNFINLTGLAPGVALPVGQVLPRINGGRPRTNEYLYDGISALQPEPGQVAFFPILDDIQAFTVEANNVPAEFGRFNGGVVNVATQSGTNEFHGSIYEFLRNEDLNARNYFALTGSRKPLYRRNLYGATLGGPILGNSLFFFIDYQGIQWAVAKTLTSTVPTSNERLGIFTGVSHIYDPTSTTYTGGRYVRNEFPSDIINIPFDTAAQALLARIPPAIPGLSVNNYKRVANDSDHQNQFDVRVDGAYKAHDRSFGRYSWFSDVDQPPPPFPDGSGATASTLIGTSGAAGLSHILGQQAVFDETHTFTLHLLNDFHLGYTRRGNSIQGPVLGNTASAALGIPGIPTNVAFNNALPLFTFSNGFQQLGPSASTFSHYQTGVWQLLDTIEYIRGRHDFKAGADIRFYQLNAVAPSNPTGSFAFTTTGTNQSGVTGSGNAFAGFLLGQVDTFSIDLQKSTLRPRDHIQEYFAQDDWHISDRMTANLGVRWTLHSPSTEKNNQGAVFDLATQQLNYAGVNGNSRSARELHWLNFAPRIGMNYRITPSTVARSGFGIVFIDQSGITTPFTLPQYPFIQNVQQKTLDSVNAAFALASGPTISPIAYTPDAGLGQSVYTADLKAGSGYVQQWNVAFEHAITNNFSVDVAYVGSHIVHVGIPDSNLNQLTVSQLAQGSSLQASVANPYYGTIPTWSSIGGKTVSAAQLLKPYPRFQNVSIYRHNSGTSNYNAIELKVEERLSHGLSFLLAYTHSKLIDDASSVFSTTVLSSPNSSSLVAADTYRPWLERDSSNGDMPNVTSVSATYDLPAGHGHRFASHGIPAAVLGGWSLYGIATLQSGMPVTITQATNYNSFAGFVLQRPTIKGNPARSSGRSPAQFFNLAAFSTTPAFSLGNASRNPVRGPAYRDLDLSLAKYAHLWSKAQLEFRGEVFDVTNTPSFAQPGGSYGAATFGTITATSTLDGERVVQFALRLSR